MANLSFFCVHTSPLLSEKENGLNQTAAMMVKKNKTASLQRCYSKPNPCFELQLLYQQKG